MAKEQLWRGKTKEEVMKLDLKDFSVLVNSRERRKLVRGFTTMEKILLKDIASGDQKVKTHCRDMVIVPAMVDKKLSVYNGKEWIPLHITIDMLGHRLGEFALTRKSVKHSAPGIGATRSSAAISVK
ncbi:MAG TPA: 30S ribosomal protein S19 [Candidatus Nanoarchaeia archaeon]|nr:30S ribosomal protein S19 [Candidatus Nanoarchaeia archaeon]